MIATDKGFIYPYDTVSESFDLPIEVNKGEAIGAMISYNNLLYIQSGTKMKLYISNGTTINFFLELSEAFLDGYISLSHIGREGMIVKDNKLYVGFGGTSVLSPAGLYVIDLETRALSIERIISTGEVGENDNVYIGTIFNTHKDSPTYLYSWRDKENSSYGVDKIGSYNYKNDEAFIISRFYKVGTKLRPRTFKGVEVACTNDLDTNDTIKIQYRTTKNGIWIDITEFTLIDNTFYAHFGVTVTNIQFKIILNNNVELIEFKAF